MPDRPNVLFLMADQMQGRVLDPDSPCQTPNLDRLAERSTRFTQAYTPNAICSPARASLMTGLLPHNHGVLWVTHVVDDDQAVLRTDKPHWAQRLVEAGYNTGYFGKWHVERSNDLGEFGWQVNGSRESELYKSHAARMLEAAQEQEFCLARYHDEPHDYEHTLHYGVTNRPPELRNMGLTTSLAAEYLEEKLQATDPWCCFVSVTEPHDPFVTGEEAFSRYDVDPLELPPNVHDDLENRPGLYRKLARAFKSMSDRELREAATCYYASITEIDEQFGRLIGMVERAGQLDNTVVVVTSDHGELLGAHGLYCKNISAFEEVYNIPLLISVPGIVRGEVSSARVGLHDLASTLLEIAGIEPITTTDSRSFASALRDPRSCEGEYRNGYAEYHGGRYLLTQRVYWEDNWKFVFNGFDQDELYDLERDPWELSNLIGMPEHADRARYMMARIWQRVRDTGDHSLYRSHYPALRLAIRGPRAVDEIDSHQESSLRRAR